MRRIDLLFLLPALALALHACQQNSVVVQEPDPLVVPPLPSADPDFQSFVFHAEDGYQYQHPSGTTVCIPPNAFVNEKGEFASGPVEVQYREFSDALNIYLAGIPMNYQGGHFSTAGSFELRASQQGVPLAVSTEESIAVRMASFVAEDEFDFFYLNEGERHWQSLGTAAPEVNSEKVALKEKIRRMQPSLKFPLNRKYMAFNYSAILDVYYNNNFSKVNDAEVSSKMTDYGLGWEEAMVSQSIEFKGKWEHAALMVWKNLDGKKFPDWTKKRWGKLKSGKGSSYVYSVAKPDSSEIFEVRLRPVMTLKELFAFSPNQWKQNYDKVMAEIESERERMEAMASVFRTFEINDMGIYNWDKMMKEEERLFLAGDFQFPGEVNEKLTELEVVYLSGDNNAVVKFPEYTWEKMALVPDEGGRFFAILPGNQLAVFPAEDYRAIDFESLRLEVNPEYQFNMEAAEQPVETAADFQKLLHI